MEGTDENGLNTLIIRANSGLQHAKAEVPTSPNSESHSIH